MAPHVPLPKQIWQPSYRQHVRGRAWSFVVVCGRSWSCAVVPGRVQSFVVVRGRAWSFVVVCGRAPSRPTAPSHTPPLPPLDNYCQINVVQTNYLIQDNIIRINIIM